MTTGASGRLWNALIRTHHITSRNKVAKLRQAASHEDVYALLRSGGSPGIMYCEGSRAGVEAWVADVQRLRYKDFQLVSRPAEIIREADGPVPESDAGGLFETDSVKDFASKMDERRILEWWKKGMGFTASDDRL